ncbi:hypothetical protein Bca52824_072984 [Brassica carinata]|uniref:Uncharacterized protein n=1 Tax=Brassica carinata TaxID=52824 RepID=A0A8X7U4F4_BRACI|nr:hypothetical protein Bca52824_072984 [Brassica carinata]
MRFFMFFSQVVQFCDVEARDKVTLGSLVNMFCLKNRVSEAQDFLPTKLRADLGNEALDEIKLVVRYVRRVGTSFPSEKTSPAASLKLELSVQTTRRLVGDCDLGDATSSRQNRLIDASTSIDLRPLHESSSLASKSDERLPQ